MRLKECHPPKKSVSTQIHTTYIAVAKPKWVCKQNYAYSDSSGAPLLAWEFLWLLSVNWGSCTHAGRMRAVGMKETRDAKVHQHSILIKFATTLNSFPNLWNLQMHTNSPCVYFFNCLGLTTMTNQHIYEKHTPHPHIHQEHNPLMHIKYRKGCGFQNR